VVISSWLRLTLLTLLTLLTRGRGEILSTSTTSFDRTLGEETVLRPTKKRLLQAEKLSTEVAVNESD
jgi:hypothetical protein